MKHLFGGAALVLCLWGVTHAATKRPAGPTRTGGPPPATRLTTTTTTATRLTSTLPPRGTTVATTSSTAGRRTTAGTGSTATTTRRLTTTTTTTAARIAPKPGGTVARIAPGGGGALVARRQAIGNVTTRLPANVRSLGVGAVRGGAGCLPAWLRSSFGGAFLVDLGGGRILVVGGRLGGCGIGVTDPLFAGCKLPVGPCVVPGLPSGGAGPINVPNGPGGEPGGPPDVPNPGGGGGLDTPPDGPPDVPNEGTGGPDGPAVRGGNNSANVNQVRFLKVSNQTNNNVKVFVQANNMKKPLEYNFKPGESNYLAVGKNQRLAADKVKIWAQSPNKNWSANKNTPMDLTRSANKGNNVGTVNVVLK